MRWIEIDARFPDPPPLPLEVPRRYAAQLRTTADAITTYATRRALALAVQPMARERMLAMIAAITDDRFLLRDDVFIGSLALVAALEKDWDAVAACTGGRILGTRVTVEKVFGDNIAALARHLATAARAQLPGRQVLAAMREVRERFAADTLDPRVAVLATRLFAGDIVAAPDPTAATRAWLDGEDIEIIDAPVPRGVADGEDPRVKIFERYAGELGDDAAIDRALELLDAPDLEPWARHVERERGPIEDAVIRGWIVNRPLPVVWETLVDPIVACWLGAESRAEISLGQRFRDLEMRGVWVKPRKEWEDPVKALATGTPRERAPAFKPGKFFKDDSRKLLEYLATAVLAKARPEDVEPAWLDFLSRRSPATTPRIESETLRWKHLLAIQSAITHRLGGLPRERAGVALRRLVTGV